ncbi:MAG: portal protein [Betaproteobacteria bacterium]|nr:portal protein [Betaproteobacteria bacterium]
MRFVGEWTINRAGVIYDADDTNTSPNDAELLTGVYRGDFRENGGKTAQDNAIYEASICGMGALRISEQFVDEEDPENDEQEIVWKTIHNAFDHVIFEANAKEADKSDASRVTVLTAFTPQAFEKKYPDASPSSAYTPTNSLYFNWCTKEQIYVAERYEIQKKKETVSVWQNLDLNEVKVYPEDQMEKALPELKAFGWTKVRDRKITRQIVEKTIFTGEEILQETKRIAGKFLPIVPFYGYRVFINGEEYYWGLVRKLMDGNRAINTLISKLTETSATSGEDMPIFLDEQVENKEDLLANRTDKNYMVINSLLDENGNILPIGQVGTLAAPRVDQSALAALDAITGFMQHKTGGAAQDTLNPEMSGKAVNALIKRDNLNTQIISDNFVKSINQGGKIYRAKAADLYTKPMMKRVIGENNIVKVEQLNQMSLDPESGNAINMNDLTRGRFSVTVDVGPQYDIEREAAVESIERVLEKLPPDSPYVGPALAMWMENIEGAGLKPLKDFNRRLMLQQGLIEAETDEEKQQVEQIQNRPDPNEELVKAATKQQESESRNLDSASRNKDADTDKKRAETAEIVVDIGIKRNENSLRRLAGIPGGQA